ncbi:hypothetical protein, partial [Microbulbifer sp. 2205BS26-8]|uniref:hypothetical protein n=1 Tax=Microbulbifer sp. 2205BS26-8 TaxID=3064386 RepID=UPI00273D55D3
EPANFDPGYEFALEDGVLVQEFRPVSEEAPEDTVQVHYRRLKQIQLCAYNANGGGRQCLSPLVFDWKLTDSAHPEDFATGIETVTDGLGAQTKFELERISDKPGEQAVGRFDEGTTLFGSVGAIPDASPVEAVEGDYRTVVTKMLRSNGYRNGWHSTEYAYQGVGLTSDKHWGFLGYSAQRIYDTEAKIVTYRQFRQDFPHFGKVARQLQYHNNHSFGELLTRRRISHSALALSVGSNTTYYPYVAQSLDTLLEDGETLGYVIADTTPQTSNYGSAGELPSGSVRTRRTVHSTQISESQSVWGDVIPVTVYGNPRRSVESTTLLENRVSGHWLIGFPSAEEQRHYAGAITGTPDQVASSTMTPYGNTNRVQTLTRYPGDAKYQLAVTYAYDAHGNINRETATGKVDATLNGTGTQTRSTVVNGAFADRRYATSLSNSLGHTITMAYDHRFGSTSRITDANNRSTRIEYDPFGRTVRRTNADGVAFASQYNFCHGICPTVGDIEVPYWVQTESPITPTAEYYYDQLGRLVQQDSQAFSGNHVSRREFKYDTQGRLALETAPFFAQGAAAVDGKPITSYEYDLRHRLKTIDKAGGGTVAIHHATSTGSSGKQVKVRVTESVVGEGGTSTQVKESYYDLNGDLAKTVDDATGLAVATDYTYYGSGLPKTVTVTGDSGTIASSFVIDQAGFRTSLTDPNLGTVTSGYNAFGEMDRQTDNKGQSITYRYDQLGRLLQQQDAQGLAQWEYDATNAIGALKNRSYTDSGTQVFLEEYTYRTDSKLDNIRTQLAINGGTPTYRHRYGYDSQGRTNKIIYPNGVEGHYRYNQRGYLQSLSSDAAGNNPLQTFDNMNAWGQVEQETYGNGVVTNRTYNPDTGRLETINTGGGQVQNNAYHWRSNGTLESRLTYSASQTLQKQENFAYDGLNRLHSATTVAGGNRVLSTRYDELGNILSKTSSNSADTQVTGYQYGQTG